MNFTENPDGILLIDKPYKWTSFDVVNKLRNLIKKQIGKKIKVGHAGTLDPLATGLLIICYGKETKNIEKYINGEKEYVAQFKFGETTPCFDLEKPVNQIFDYKHITKDLLNNALTKHIGEQLQTPPLFSAKQIEGKRAYELARQGLNTVVKAQSINISELKLLKFDLPFVDLKIVCSKGTYIRALARDFGQELNSGAHLTSLRRTRAGNFKIDDALNFLELISFMNKNENKSN